jgi:hypothetical protein
MKRNKQHWKTWRYSVATRVSDLSVDELRALIQEVITQTLIELFRDPDEGLELRKDFMDALQQSLRTVEAGDVTLSAESVTTKLGLSW